MSEIKNMENVIKEETTAAVQEPSAPEVPAAPVPHRVVVDTGLEAVEICNLQGAVIGTLYFHPADLGIIDRWNAMVKDFSEVTKPLEDAAETEEGALPALAEAKERLCAALDKVFDGNVSEAFFSRVHPFSLVNGRFYCENVMDAVADYMGQRFSAEFERVNRQQTERMAAYTNGARTGKHKNGKTRPAAKK